jgi:hypothetical protein
VSSAWITSLNSASSDWSQSTVLDTTVVSGLANPKNCRPTSGRVEVCSSAYGNTGWLGVAQIWITGGTHITQGVVKLNDTYFRSGTYNKPEWRNLVTCQEIGHTFGLDHQDTNFDNTNLGTCMDYTSNPLGPPDNERPNKHDYDELVTIYSHTDSITTVGSGTAKTPSVGNLNAPSEWGKLVSQSANGKSATFERDFGHGVKIVTHVTYAE